MPMLFRIGFSTQRCKGRRGGDILFGGEPFDKLKALSKVEGSRQIKEILLFWNKALSALYRLERTPGNFRP
jgi:hypothetical protein